MTAEKAVSEYYSCNKSLHSHALRMCCPGTVEVEAKLDLFAYVSLAPMLLCLVLDKYAVGAYVCYQYEL